MSSRAVNASSWRLNHAIGEAIAAHKDDRIEVVGERAKVTTSERVRLVPSREG